MRLLITNRHKQVKHSRTLRYSIDMEEMDRACKTHGEKTKAYWVSVGTLEERPLGIL
jgi:hypothetical protein